MTEPRATYTLRAGMPRRFDLTIPGNPIPKGRPRVTERGTFTPTRTSEYEALVRGYVALAWHGDPLTVALALTLRFYRATAHKCDLDNLVKSISDAIQGVVFEDDAQVWVLHAAKGIDRDNPRVEILVEVL